MSILTGLSAPLTSSSTLQSKFAQAEKNGDAVLESTSETIATAAEEASEATNADITEQFDTFLKLLTAQIKNQDPLAPLDSTQFVEQLATFSNLELQAKGNQTLESIAQMLAEDIYGTDTES